MSKNYLINQIVFEDQPKEKLEAMLPALVKDIAQFIGYEKTFLLVQKMGGIHFAVPRGESISGVAKSEREQRLIDLLGDKSAQEFMRIYGGAKLYIPRCESVLRELRNQKFIDVVLATVSENCSITQAVEKYAYEFGMSDRWAWTLLRKRQILPNAVVDDRQMDLFGE